ncbi:hypothetical protein VTK73DRAFT_9540 [Phialemonium thermophilum]|uniref:Cytochrome P450 n=1 Tax=Phialemonium thermophilum TaxID=223376 RepID=A0ABR3XK87_9PEZI
MDPREPPVIRPQIPVFGHMIGIAVHRVSYFTRLRSRTRLPAVTLPMFNTKLYVIFSPPLVQSALRARSMDSQEFTTPYIPALFGISKRSHRRLLGEDGFHESVAPPFHHIFRSTLSGEPLIELTRAVMDSVADALNEIGKEGVEVPNLYLWVREKVTCATAAGLYGKKHNPYKDAAVIDAQWDFEEGLFPLSTGLLPSILARKAYLARVKVREALEPYYRGLHDQDPEASEMVRTRTRLLREFELPIDELARLEVSVMLAASSNTAPTVFWCLALVWQRPDILEDLRAEVSRVIDVQSIDSGKVATMHFGRLESECPLLVACYREALRISSQVIMFRKVRSDTVISDGMGGSYLLRAGNIVMLPAKEVHRDETIWTTTGAAFVGVQITTHGGDGENEKITKSTHVDGRADLGPTYFVPRRFVPGEGDFTPDKEGARRRRTALVPFGGGRHLCPGRHLAFNEVAAFLAAAVAGFEIDGLDGEKLRLQQARMASVTKPEPGFEGGTVVLRRRKGWEEVTWRFEP